MHWLLIRPAVGWGAFLLVHAVGIPLVYGLGKLACARRGCRQPDAAGGIDAAPIQ